MLHVCFPHCYGYLLIGAVQVDLPRKDQLAESLGRHLHVVGVVVTHLVDKDVELLLAYLSHDVPLFIIISTLASSQINR